MKTRIILSIAVIGVVLSFIGGCGPAKEPGVKVEPTEQVIVAQEAAPKPPVVKEKPVVLAKIEPKVAEAPVEGPKKKIVLTFAPGSKATYTVTNMAGKDYEFDQPSLAKKQVKNTLSKTETVLLQEVQSIGEDATALIKVTIESVKYMSQSANGSITEFDSASEPDSKNVLMQLVGLSYTVRISPTGQVTQVNAAEARKAVKGGPASRLTLAESRLSDSEIIKRHQIVALPDTDKNVLSVGATWNRIVASPRGMLEAKFFEKVYTLKKITECGGETIAVITMKAIPSAEKAANLPASQDGMGVFSKVFDYSDEYHGKLVINLSTGLVKEYEESLKATWIAAEAPEEQKSDAGPDVLTMGFKSGHSIKAN